MTCQEHLSEMKVADRVAEVKVIVSVAEMKEGVSVAETNIHRDTARVTVDGTWKGVRLGGDAFVHRRGHGHDHGHGRGRGHCVEGHGRGHCHGRGRRIDDASGRATPPAGSLIRNKNTGVSGLRKLVTCRSLFTRDLTSSILLLPLVPRR